MRFKRYNQLSEWDSMVDMMASMRRNMASFQIVFNEHSHITGIIWKEKKKKQPEPKSYKAGADATRA